MHLKTAPRRAYEFLKHWRRLDGEAWDAAQAAVLDTVLAGMPQSAEDDGILQVAAAVAQPEDISAVLAVLLALPRTTESKQGAKQALLLLAALYQKQPAATIEALSWVLTPDADQDITCRVEAAEAMAAAARHAEDAAPAAATGPPLWRPVAVSNLAASLAGDSSLRVRRAVMAALAAVEVAASSEQERVVAAVVALKCRDKDDSIRQTAWQMLAQLPMAALLAALTPADWRALFDAALVPPSQPQPRDPAAATAGLRPTLQQLRDQQGADAAADVASADAPAGATKQGREHRLQQGESGVAMQQGQQMLRRFLTEGLPPATHMDAEEDDGALDDRDRVQAERLSWLDLVQQPSHVLEAYSGVVRSCVPARVVVAAAGVPAEEPEPLIWG